MRLKFAAIAFLIISSLSCAKYNDSENGKRRNQLDIPAVSVDLDGDGIADRVTIIKNSARDVTLTAEIKKSSGIKKDLLKFYIDAGKQDGFFSWPVELIPEPLDYDPDPGIGHLQGYVKSDRTIGLRISDGECDDFHIYWNHDRQSIDWWRQ